jgi:hypothetical protein
VGRHQNTQNKYDIFLHAPLVFLSMTTFRADIPLLLHSMRRLLLQWEATVLLLKKSPELFSNISSFVKAPIKMLLFYQSVLEL